MHAHSAASAGTPLAEAPKTDKGRYKLDPTRRWPTRHRGISFRVNRSLERSYFVHEKGKFVPAGRTETEALAKQAEIRGKRARGERVIVASRVELKFVAEEWFSDVSRRVRPSTARDYRSYLDRVLIPRFGERGIGSITPEEIVDLVQELERAGKSQSTIANAVKPLNGLLGFALFKGLIATNPMSQIPRGYKPSCNVKRDHREWTTTEVDRVIAEARKRDARPEAQQSYALAIEVLLRCGLRLGEMLALRQQDIDFEHEVLLIRNSWTKDSKLGPVKTSASERRVPVTRDLIGRLMMRSLHLDAEADTFLFAAKKGENPPSQSNFRRRGWNPAVQAAGLTEGPRVTPHDARHAFTSQMAHLDLTSGDLAPILGHTTAGITEAIYVHAFNREAREARIREAMVAASIGAVG